MKTDATNKALRLVVGTGSGSTITLLASYNMVVDRSKPLPKEPDTTALDDGGLIESGSNT